MKDKRMIWLAVGLVLVAIVLSYFWLRSERERQLAVQEVGTETLDVESAVLEEDGGEELAVKLYVYNPGAVSPGEGFLRRVDGTIYQTDDDVLKARQIVNLLLKGIGRQKPGPETSTRSYLDRTRLRDLYILKDGTAVVDLSSETISGMAGGITSELALIRSVTRSLRVNVVPVKQVRFLVDGKERETLAGHVSITHPFR